MLIYQNAKGVRLQNKVGNICFNGHVKTPIRMLIECVIKTSHKAPKQHVFFLFLMFDLNHDFYCLIKITDLHQMI